MVKIINIITTLTMTITIIIIVNCERFEIVVAWIMVIMMMITIMSTMMANAIMRTKDKMDTQVEGIFVASSESSL